MTRITPRTCLWPLAASLSLTFALSIGLTYRSNHHCYAGTCGEWLFPLQARLHVVIWFCWLAISTTVLSVRAFHPSMRRILRRPVLSGKLPLLRKQLTFSGILVVFWVVLLYGIITGIWWLKLKDYFTERGLEGGVFAGNRRLAAIALTGHMCDVTMGMALIPISRHSALASFFRLSVATTLTFHMVTAYTLFALVLTHGLLYISWISVFEALSSTLRKVYPVLNPTYLYDEIWPGSRSSLGIWRASLIFTGSTTGLIMLLIAITTLPSIRSRHFNLFYFTHLLGILAVIIICLHASTMFYCTSPGLMMWLLDWLMRLYELGASLHGKISTYGTGWYCLTIPLPRRRLDGCACASPLAHFYIYHSDSSIRELHPFTTITHLASQNAVTSPSEHDITMQFLFRKRGKAALLPVIPAAAKVGFAPSFFGAARKLKRRKASLQWTDRLASLIDEEQNDGMIEGAFENSIGSSSKNRKPIPISLRLEGPYFTIADPSHYHTVICFVAGTGVSGALAITGAFKELDRQCSSASQKADCRPKSSTNRTAETLEGESKILVTERERIWKRCVVVWSIREDDFVELPEFHQTSTPNLQIITHLTGNNRPRLSIGNALNHLLQPPDETLQSESEKRKIWVYISGPNAFISAGEAACKERVSSRVEYYGARWDI